MSTDAPKLHEWLCIMPDAPNAHEKRLEVRPAHFDGVKKLAAEGSLTWGGAILNELPESDDATKFNFHGSVLTLTAATKEEVIEKLKTDVYTQAGVWDWEKVQILPFRCAVRVPLNK